MDHAGDVHRAVRQAAGLDIVAALDGVIQLHQGNVIDLLARLVVLMLHHPLGEADLCIGTWVGQFACAKHQLPIGQMPATEKSTKASWIPVPPLLHCLHHRK